MDGRYSIMIYSRRLILLPLLWLSFAELVFPQLSPGELSRPHAELEGLSNCTQCHVLGNKVSADKCLACHTEIRDRITARKGYHSSSDVTGKLCFSCHSEHNGRNFQLVRIDPLKFDHRLTGYTLSTPHSKAECRECHTSERISDPKLRARKTTYLGLKTECLTCHTDYHRQTLSTSCLNCHTEEGFKPASKFNHSSARFLLAGKHKTVECIKCHRVEIIGGNKFQEFRGVRYSNCSSCHTDPHRNQFGPDCRKCHTEDSFHAVKTVSGFDHSRTAFPLEDKHSGVDCRACHKTKFTDPVRHRFCTDCHRDYHNGQFSKNGVSPDCSDCHSVKGFNLFSFSLERHNAGIFPLNLSHSAVPCFECHKKAEKWNFRGIGIKCSDCHPDVHQRIIQPKYYPGSDCKACHRESRWSDITFNHSLTGFSLTGAHAGLGCRACHFRPDSKGVVQQKFYELTTTCSGCHSDNHNRQFEKNGITLCTDCHGTENWKASKFNHDNTAFKLDGKHAEVACVKCHKPVVEGNRSFINYKIKEHKCESCH